MPPLLSTWSIFIILKKKMHHFKIKVGFHMDLNFNFLLYWPLEIKWHHFKIKIVFHMDLNFNFLLYWPLEKIFIILRKWHQLKNRSLVSYSSISSLDEWMVYFRHRERTNKEVVSAVSLERHERDTFLFLIMFRSKMTSIKHTTKKVRL